MDRCVDRDAASRAGERLRKMRRSNAYADDY